MNLPRKAISRGSVPVFLNKPITTSDFTGEGRIPAPPSGSARATARNVHNMKKAKESMARKCHRYKPNHGTARKRHMI